MILNTKALMEQACKTTGLNDFGDDWFVAPLEKLVSIINREAGLISITEGPVERLSSALQNRLKLNQLLKNQPEIKNEKIDVGGVIIGLPRTGSTILHRLLASGHSMTAPYWWETTFPLPFDEESPGDPSPRQELAKQVVKTLLEQWPDFESIDPMNAMGINEEVVLLEMGFLCTLYDSIMNIPSYGFWQAEQDQTPAYKELKIWLQVLQSQNPARRNKKWILKSPHHLLGGMTGLLNVFPEAKLIMTHRHLSQVLPSYCSMCASMTSTSSSTYRRKSQGQYWSTRFASGLDNFMALRKRLPVNKIFDVQFIDTVKNPIDVAMNVLAFIGMTATDEDLAAFSRCLEENQREQRPSHKYVAQEFGLSDEKIEHDFASYIDTWLETKA